MLNVTVFTQLLKTKDVLCKLADVSLLMHYLKRR